MSKTIDTISTYIAYFLIFHTGLAVFMPFAAAWKPLAIAVGCSIVAVSVGIGWVAGRARFSAAKNNQRFTEDT